MKKPVVFFDFDNTITACDTFDGMLPLFSRTKRWITLERDWKKGRISSRECLAGQLQGLSLTRRSLDEYLSGIKLDPCFKDLLGLLRLKKIKTVVLSDNFDYILKSIFRNHGLPNLKFYCNQLSFKNGRMIAGFPLSGPECRICGHCKTRSLLAEAAGDEPIFYIGDGYSDSCPARYAQVVFAKGELSRLCQKRKIDFLPYRSLRDVYRYFNTRP
ncbi:MAG: hypothetical protein A3G38_01790 [Omnitrophica WOR_2 bacterium RIFCSPLOWO2_12_FULL_51_8]|nr:MAG: hypothetical protein A3G38_01790 [Omnitrophica WOR_2 bacterium RIFCSPLOWO2_12_FULL_51_8]